MTDFSACRTGLVSDLLLQCGQGDEAAFAAIWDIFYSVIRAATAVELPPQEVDEALQSAFVRLWQDAPSYRPGGATAVEWVMQHVFTTRAGELSRAPAGG